MLTVSPPKRTVKVKSVDAVKRQVRKIFHEFRKPILFHKPCVIYFNEHPLRVANSMIELAYLWGETDLIQFGLQGLNHDIGKAHESMLGYMSYFQGKPCDAPQRRVMREGHTRLGPVMLDRLLTQTEFSRFESYRDQMIEVIRYHHTEADPLMASRSIGVKIAGVVDKFDAMTSGEEERSHNKRPRTKSEAVHELWMMVQKEEIDSDVTTRFIEDILRMKIPSLH